MPKKLYDLVGVDGNAFCIMGYVIKAMRECKKSKEEIEAYRKAAAAAAGDYTNLIAVSCTIIDECNGL